MPATENSAQEQALSAETPVLFYATRSYCRRPCWQEDTGFQYAPPPTLRASSPPSTIKARFGGGNHLCISISGNDIEFPLSVAPVTESSCHNFTIHHNSKWKAPAGASYVPLLREFVEGVRISPHNGNHAYLGFEHGYRNARYKPNSSLVIHNRDDRHAGFLAYASNHANQKSIASAGNLPYGP